MHTRTIIWAAAACAVFQLASLPAEGQILEAVGERALGMGGAFVAVANDSSATWWNPAAQADGPFFDLSTGRSVNDRLAGVPAGRDRVSGFAISTPVIGASFYRIALGQAQEPAAASVGGGEAHRGLVSWTASAFGVSFVQTVVEGTHVGATVKYVRGTLRTGSTLGSTTAEDGLDAAASLAGGRGEGTFDLDLGVLATAGPLRLGALVRNVRASGSAESAFVLPRQARIGLAIATEQVGGPPLTVSIDADLRPYVATSGRRQVVAVGAEGWLAGKRVGLRAGARFNRAGLRERAITAGASVALRPGSFLEGHVVVGATPAERGWGSGVRVSF